MRAKRPQMQVLRHRRGAIATFRLARLDCRSIAATRSCRCSRHNNRSCCLTALPLHRTLMGVHGLEGADPGTVDRCAHRHLGPSPPALPDRACLAAEVYVLLPGRAASLA